RSGMIHAAPRFAPVCIASREIATTSNAAPTRRSPRGRSAVPVRSRGTRRVSRVGRAFSSPGSPVGTVTTNHTYSATPAPTRVIRNISTRTKATGNRRCAASPAHTPSTHRPCRGRRSGGRGTAVVEGELLVTGSIVARAGTVVVAPAGEFRGSREPGGLWLRPNQGRVRVAPDTAQRALPVDWRHELLCT